jgi:hypothetical protein
MKAVKDDASQRRISSSFERGDANATSAREIAPEKGKPNHLSMSVGARNPDLY